MPTRPIEDAQRDLEHYRDAIVDCVLRAHVEYLTVPGLHRLTLGCKSDMLSNLIRHYLRVWSETQRGVDFFSNGNLHTFTFGNNWIVRVKKMDDLYRVGVSPTIASDQYDRNEIPENITATLLGEAEATLLYLGWQVMDNAPKQPHISLICNNRFGEVHWVWPLSGPEPEPPLPLPLPLPELPSAPEPSVRIRVRAGASQKRSGG